MEKGKKAKKEGRVVLGVGHPFFMRLSTDATSVSLYGGNCQWDKPKTLKFGSLGGYNKIRLIAEVIE